MGKNNTYDDQQVLSTVESGKDYLSKLQDLLMSVDLAEEQVESTANQTILDVEKTFDTIATSLSSLLTKQRQKLIGEIKKIEKDGLEPLKACREVITKKLDSTEQFIAEGESILKEGLTSSENSYKFCEKASCLGSLPAVPALEEVPHISFQSKASFLNSQLEESIMNLGTVSQMGPVQITHMEEKPGALLISWEEVDSERTVDIHAFRLQMAHGDIRKRPNLIDTNFHDIYVGPDCQFLARDLSFDTPYTFRVCCIAEGEVDWSAWSLSKVARSKLVPFSWVRDNQHYTVTNEGKIACKSDAEPSVLLSSSAQFTLGHSIEFTVLECGKDTVGQGLGLVKGAPRPGNLIHPGSLFLTTQGSVFIDGEERSIALPPLKAGARVSFECLRARSSRLLVNIGTGHRVVTYDWRPKRDDDEKGTPRSLHFALCFTYPGWKILVE